MIFLSQRPNNDPEPWLDLHTLNRFARQNTLTRGYTFAPRPEFTQTRDPKPWLNNLTGQRFEKGSLKWSPRHEEFDTPVNGILAEFRSTWTSNYREGAQNWLIYINGSWGIKSIEHSTVQQRDHARRVLHLLAVISE